MTAWLTPAVLAANPTWTAQTSPQGVQETTTQILARLPQATALHPNIIVIEAGTWNTLWTCDYSGPSDYPVGPGPCTDITAMVSEIQAANIYPIICIPPPWGVGPLQEQIDNNDPAITATHQQDLGGLYYALDYQLGYPTYVDMGKVEFYSLLGTPLPDYGTTLSMAYSPQYTTDGVNPDAAAGQQMVTAVQAAIAASKVGAALRRNPVVGAAIQPERALVNR